MPKPSTTDVSLIVGLLIVPPVTAWWVLSTLLHNGALVPTPLAVMLEFKALYPVFLSGLAVTAEEAILGLLGGIVFSLGLVLMMFFYRSSERVIMPYAIALKATPVIALAPLISVWLGTGISSKILVAAMISFFPVLQESYDALETTVPTEAKIYGLALGASRLRDLRYIRFGYALPTFFGSLKIG
jgi:ABC-type nitrate/sulfonate/bicarbonate transport system permease component